VNRIKWACVAAAVLTVNSASAATFTFVNKDDPGEGLNDATAITPTGGNSATTLGAARLAVLTEAGRIWGLQLTSAVTIVVEAKFDPLTCTPTLGTVGSAGPLAFFSNSNSPNIAYPAALADAMSGTNLGSPAANDISATFSSTVGSPTCLGGAQFYLGLDHAAGSNIDLLNIVLHEFGHGLGFFSAVQQDGTSAFGATSSVLTIYDQSVYSEAHAKFWPAMTPAERAASLTSGTSLVWNGTAVNGRTNLLSDGLSGGARAKLYAPATYSARSTGSHWDTTVQWIPPGSTQRGLLMAPFLTTNPLALTDFTGCVFQDLGWQGTRCVDQTGAGLSPVAVAQTVAASEDTAVQITILGTDLDTASLTYSIVTQPTRGLLAAPATLVSGNGVVYTFTPTANLNGIDTFVFQVTDGINTPSSATITINVAAVNDAPVANAQTLSATGGTPLAIALTGSDVEASALTYAVVSDPTHGTLTGTLPNLSYKAEKRYNGADTFTFRVNDGALNSSIATVTINVTAAPKSGGGSLDGLGLLLLAAMFFFARWRRQPASS
jgi:hypothetical protein